MCALGREGATGRNSLHTEGVSAGWELWCQQGCAVKMEKYYHLQVPLANLQITAFPQYFPALLFAISKYLEERSTGRR